MEIAALGRESFADLPDDFIRVGTLASLAESVAKVGDVAAARAIGRLLSPYAGHNAMHGTADSFRNDLRLLLPAAGVDRRPIAWRMRAEGKDDRTGQVIVVAPAGAARVSLTEAGAAPVPVVLDPGGSGIATLAPDTTASVTAYAADGSVLGSTPVPAFETNSGGIPGDDLKTRVVP